MTDMTDPASGAATKVILVRHGESVANAGGKPEKVEAVYFTSFVMQ